MDTDFDLARFGERLKGVRTKRQLTLKDVSEETKISVPTLSRIERGDAKGVEHKTLFVLSSWSGLNLDLFRTDPVPDPRRRKPVMPTPDVVELHLRADKNLSPKTAELLVKMFRAAYEEAASED